MDQDERGETWKCIQTNVPSKGMRHLGQKWKGCGTDLGR